MRTVLPWLLVVILAASLLFVSQQGQRKDSRITELQHQAREVENLQAEVQELRQAKASASVLSQPRTENTEMLKLRNQVTLLKRDNDTFTARKLHAEELQIESQLTPESIVQLVKENQQLRSKAQEFQVMKQRAEAEMQASRAPLNACINNLRQLDGATDQWAIENKKTTGDLVTANDIAPYLKKFPQCPSGGAYTIGPVDTMPTCSIPGHIIPPR